MTLKVDPLYRVFNGNCLVDAIGVVHCILDITVSVIVVTFKFWLGLLRIGFNVLTPIFSGMCHRGVQE